MGTMRSPEVGEAYIVHQKGNEIDSTYWRILNESGNPRPEFRRECISEVDMGSYGQDHVTVIPFSIKNGKPTEYFSHGEVARDNS